MTIEQKAREIAERMAPAGEVWDSDVERISLGIIEGIKVADRIGTCSNTTGRSNCCEQTGEDIADAIRALIEEQKV